MYIHQKHLDDSLANSTPKVFNHEHIRSLKVTILFGVPKGIRTPVAAVKGQCPRPLDDGDKLNAF